MREKIYYIRRRLKPTSELKRRVIERARKLKAGRKSFGSKKTTADSKQIIYIGTIGKEEYFTMRMNRANFGMDNAKSNLPAAVISAAACAAIVIGIGAVALRGGDNQMLTENGAGAAPASQDSGISVSAADKNENTIPEKAESSASEKGQSDAAVSSATETAVPSVSGEINSEAGSANVPEKVEMTVDKMLSMDGAQLRALANDDYEIIEGRSAQSASFGLKCAAFPEYVFVLQRVEGFTNKPENTVKVPYGDFVYELSDKIEQLNLYEGAEVGSGVKVGMTYNEIEEQLGHDIEVSAAFSTLGMAAWTEIDGRYWALHFDVTDEQAEEIWERLYASTETGQTTLDDPGHVDLSDMDPVCDLAVFDIDADN